ncbi:MAG: hypothetical protein U5Q44_12605 [Dehalococcoidia bacterium]|nr:hypothetical protein [Dehalococcoidia bacterium]
MHPRDDEDTINLGLDDEDEEYWDEEEDAPGPDERDIDLLDGRWEERYYSGQERTRDWGTIGLAVAIVAAASLILPGLLVFFRGF